MRMVLRGKEKTLKYLLNTCSLSTDKFNPHLTAVPLLLLSAVSFCCCCCPKYLYKSPNLISDGMQRLNYVPLYWEASYPPADRVIQSVQFQSQGDQGVLLLIRFSLSAAQSH